VPMHDEVAKGTLKSILEQAGIELEDFLNLL
jgi:predicted RNA binding protein YcfA (HicA-like mRNA interferase family)